MIHAELWKKIKGIELDSISVGKTFSEHLAAENGWTLAFAQRAVREYKKFLYLYAVSERELIPSNVVEQVWSLHLTDTRHYWGTFSNIIGKQLHHGKVGENSADNQQFAKRYNDTMRLYQDEFQSRPKPEFWPSVENLLALDPRMERVDRSRNIVLQKPTMELWRSVGRFAGVATFPLSVVVYAVNKSSGISPGNISPLGWLVVAAIAVVIAVFGCLVWQMEAKAKTSQDEQEVQDDMQEIQPRFT